jgi:anthranilate synthase component 1
MIQPSLDAVKAIAEKGSIIPVCKDILGDILTPAAAFLRVAHGRRRVFLLESVEGGERLARYSFIGWDPFVMVRGKGTSVSIERQGEIIRDFRQLQAGADTGSASIPWRRCRVFCLRYRPPI